MVESVAVRRLCLMADIDRYSQNDNPVQVEFQRRLQDVLDKTLTSAKIALDRTWRKYQGDRQLIVLPVGLNEAAAFPLLIRGLLTHLDHDRKRTPGIPLRLRVSAAQGVVTRAKTGYVGRAVVTAARLMDSPAVREALETQHAALFALIVPDDLYQGVLTHGYGGVPAGGFRRVTVDLPDKQWHTNAWVCAWEPGSLKPAANRTAQKLRNAVTSAAGGVPGGLYDTANSQGTDHDPVDATHETSDYHEGSMEIVDYATEAHVYASEGTGYLAEEHAYSVEEYTGLGYESSDSLESSGSGADSPDELY